MRRAAAITDTTTAADSAGGHVVVSGIRRQVRSVSIDPQWAGTARNTEIESELRDALRAFVDRSTTGELTKGPRSAAISELMGMVADPQLTIQRISRGTTPRSTTHEGHGQ